MNRYDIDPCPAPRMTRSDKWREPRRPCVQRYFDFRDLCRLKRVEVPDGSHVTFIIAMPDSWSAKKKALHDGQPHQQRPDIDNCVKAVLDAVHDEDSMIHDIRGTKYWGHAGAIYVRPMGGI